MKHRIPFRLVEELISGQKTASDVREMTQEDLFEVGLVEKEVEKIAAAATFHGQEMARAFHQKLAEMASGTTTAPDLQGETPLQKEQPTEGGAVSTDHAAKDPVPQAAAMAEVKKLLQRPKLQHSSGEGSGAAGELAGVDSNEVSTAGTNGEIGKTKTAEEQLIDDLLYLG